MGFCEHECKACGNEWTCEFPYFSSHEFFEDVVQSGSYCNAYCSNCYAEERIQIDKIFESRVDKSYIEVNLKKKKKKDLINNYTSDGF